jgi:hypothetical protein
MIVEAGGEKTNVGDGKANTRDENADGGKEQGIYIRQRIDA